MKIVALGNSLTMGLQSNLNNPFAFQVTPYTDHLKDLAQSYIDTHKLGIRLEIVNKGVCGELTSNMLIRFNKDVLEQQPDYVIIIGGSNDVGWGIYPKEIFNNLKAMYDKAETGHVQPISCSIPSIIGFDDLIPPRIELNKLIQEEAEKRTIPFVDLYRATSDPKTSQLLAEYSSDGLHLNTDGYRTIGKVVFKEWLRKVLEEYAK